jgi:hypothetical protein
LHNFFPFSLKNSVTDFWYSFLLFSDRMSIIVALWSSYSLQSQKICFSLGTPSPHSHSAVDKMLNLLKLAVGLAWSDLIRFIDTKARRFNFILRNHGDEPFL